MADDARQCKRPGWDSYTYASAQLDKQFSHIPATQIVAYDAQGTDDFTVYDVANLSSQTPTDLTATRCDSAQVLANSLETDFEENFVNTSLQAEGLVMDLYASPNQGTWTLIHRGNDGISCVVSSGTGWTDASTPADVINIAHLAS